RPRSAAEFDVRMIRTSLRVARVRAAETVAPAVVDPELPFAVVLGHTAGHGVQLDVLLEVEPMAALIDVQALVLIFVEPVRKDIARIVLSIFDAAIGRARRHLRFRAAGRPALADVRRRGKGIDEVDAAPSGLTIERAPELGVARELTLARVLAFEI